MLVWLVACYSGWIRGVDKITLVSKKNTWFPVGAGDSPLKVLNTETRLSRRELGRAVSDLLDSHRRSKIATAHCQVFIYSVLRTEYVHGPIFCFSSSMSKCEVSIHGNSGVNCRDVRKSWELRRSLYVVRSLIRSSEYQYTICNMQYKYKYKYMLYILYCISKRSRKQQ